MRKTAPLAGTPADAPKEPGGYLPVNDLPPDRDDSTMDPAQRAKIQAELIAARDRQAAAHEGRLKEQIEWATNRVIASNATAIGDTRLRSEVAKQYGLSARRISNIMRGSSSIGPPSYWRAAPLGVRHAGIKLFLLVAVSAGVIRNPTRIR